MYAGLRIHDSWPYALAVSYSALFFLFFAVLQDTGIDTLVAECLARPWIKRLHCHVGSQGALRLTTCFRHLFSVFSC